MTKCYTGDVLLLYQSASCVREGGQFFSGALFERFVVLVLIQKEVKIILEL